MKIEFMAAVLIAAALPAVAAEGIRTGKWEYTVTTRMPDMPQLPSNAQMPTAGGMTDVDLVASGGI